ncbi:hypothetical protein [Nostoc sp. PCC 7107]|uniref:hypothetical protein n=1 Tax=Nostoc sp. PCC 7107 TaxID=317936 RepID=UPI00029F26E1|nr:hypothetical protein [Nostoc sp. PCC 7107]AFY43639.1 hypothetical protein Nos7107_3048 [Nostoc sp. PCC 7107]
MSREEEIKAAIVVTPETILFASPEMNSAAEQASWRLGEFVDFLDALDPKLERHESTLLAAAIIQSLPELINTNPELQAGIKQLAQEIRANRK